MKYAIAHDYGDDGWVFVGDDLPVDKRYNFVRKTFDTFGQAYLHAIRLGYSSRFEVFGVFDSEDIKVEVNSPKQDL